MSWAVAFTVLLAPLVHAQVNFTITNTSPFSLDIASGYASATNNAILTGPQNTSTQAVSASTDGTIANGGGTIDITTIKDNVVRVQVNSSEAFVGAQFTVSESDHFYGVWEYPWNTSITSNDVSFDLKGVGNEDGVNWDNARAPFFLTSAGYGVYTDTLAMGSYSFSSGVAQYVFNTSSLVYYVILPTTSNDYKSIIESYMGLSAYIEMPPDSAFGPTFWSDNFEQDFHDGVINAQENYHDVIDHLYYNQIRATSMFADRPYGSGNYSFGNFDFDPVFYPTPAEFIANLSSYGFDFQIWVANRAFLDTRLFNTSEENGWLFPGIDPEFFLGPALNLSIPEAYAYFADGLTNYTNLGVRGYKIDRGEEGEMPVWEQNYQMDLFEQMCYDNMKSKWGQSSFYNFARSVVDRSRARTAVWNGDSHANFSGLAYTVASGIRAGLIGMSQWGSDTGGYVRVTGNTQSPTEEVWARWMHFSTFSPVYEFMLGTNHTPWYPPYTESTVSLVKQTANLHHDLLPYIRSYTYVASTTGVSVMRALFLEEPDDPDVYTINDEYFFGDAFLVAPIVTAGGSRSVYFPLGSSYLEYFNKTDIHEGGTNASVSLDTLSTPVYVREGSIVVRGDIYQGNNKWTPDWQPFLTVEIFPSWNVQQQTFTYFAGDPANGTAVNVSVSTSADYQSVSVTYGAVGVDGTIVLYTSGGNQTATLYANGGHIGFSAVDSLFG